MVADVINGKANINMLVDQEILDAMSRLETFMNEVSKEDHTLLAEAVMYSLGSGGKRLRPLLLFTIYKSLGGTDIDEIIPLAASIEMVHTATLVHDDIIDDAPVRRGKQSLFRKFGLPYAVVGGDFLFVKAFELATTYKRDIMTMVAKACIDLAEGEVLETQFRYKENMDINDYITIVTKKTASAIAAVGRSAAMVVDAGIGVERAMEKYGLNLGIAFQIRDDVLDIFGTEEVIGKKRFTDLRTGNHTVISLIAMGKLGTANKKRFTELFKKKEKTEEDMGELLSLIKESNADKMAMDIAKQYVAEAIDELKWISDVQYKNILENIAKISIERDH